MRFESTVLIAFETHPERGRCAAALGAVSHERIVGLPANAAGLAKRGWARPHAVAFPAPALIAATVLNQRPRRRQRQPRDVRRVFVRKVCDLLRHVGFMDDE